MAIDYFSPEQTGQYFDSFGADNTPADFMPGWQSYYYTGQGNQGGGVDNRFLGPRVSFQNEFDSLGLDPNGTYGSSYAQPEGYNSDATRSRVLYQQVGDQWNPVSSRSTPDKNSTMNFLSKYMQALGAMGGLAGLYGAAGGAGSGISASTPGTATGSGLGVTQGSGLSLAAPTAGATGSGLYTPALAGGVGGAAGGAVGLSNLYDSPQTFGDYSLTSASDFAPSGGDGLSMGDYNLGDGYSGVFDSLTSPGISDYGNINLSSTGPQSFSGDIGTGVSESNALLDNVRKRLGQQFTGARGGRNLLDLMRRGVGVYNANKQMKANKAASGGLQQQVKTLQDMFTPGGAYAQQLRQQLERRDAAAGRRSQYGPREAELMAALARENARMAPSLASIYNQQSNIQNQNFGLRNQRDNVILEAIGRPVSNLIGDMAGPGIRGGLDFLGSLFGG